MMKPSPEGEQDSVLCDHPITAQASQPVSVCFIESHLEQGIKHKNL